MSKYSTTKLSRQIGCQAAIRFVLYRLGLRKMEAQKVQLECWMLVREMVFFPFLWCVPIFSHFPRFSLRWRPVECIMIPSISVPKLRLATSHQARTPNNLGREVAQAAEAAVANSVFVRAFQFDVEKWWTDRGKPSKLLEHIGTMMTTAIKVAALESRHLQVFQNAGKNWGANHNPIQFQTKIDAYAILCPRPTLSATNRDGWVEPLRTATAKPIATARLRRCPFQHGVILGHANGTIESNQWVETTEILTLFLMKMQEASWEDEIISNDLRLSGRLHCGPWSSAPPHKVVAQKIWYVCTISHLQPSMSPTNPWRARVI